MRRSVNATNSQWWGGYVGVLQSDNVTCWGVCVPPTATPVTVCITCMGMKYKSCKSTHTLPGCQKIAKFKGWARDPVPYAVSQIWVASLVLLERMMWKIDTPFRLEKQMYLRWNIQMGLSEFGYQDVNWIELAHSVFWWRGFVMMVIKLHKP